MLIVFAMSRMHAWFLLDLAIRDTQDGWPKWTSSAASNGLHLSLKCPYGAPGDRLWVRESGWLDKREKRFFCYDATRKICKQSDIRDDYMEIEKEPSRDELKRCYRSVPSIHMPRWASRITLEITEVRVQRVQEISEEDAIAEGVLSKIGGRVHDLLPGQTAKSLFRELWDLLNLKRGFGWDTNPWVWCVTFRRSGLPQ